MSTPSTTAAPEVEPENGSRLMRIGELAERSGRTVRTLHFYEELGLLSPAGRTKGGFRLYDENALLRIEWISKLQDLGFSLPEVKDFLTNLHANPSAPAMMAGLRDFYSQKLEETRAAVRRLRALELELSLAMAYLDGCKTCAPLTAKGACHTCNEDEHVGQAVPPLVAAVRPEPSP